MTGCCRLRRGGNEEGTSCIAVLRGHTRGIRSVCSSPTGNRLLTASEDSSVRVWNPWEDNDALCVLKGHQGKLHQVQYTMQRHQCQQFCRFLSSPTAVQHQLGLMVLYACGTLTSTASSARWNTWKSMAG